MRGGGLRAQWGAAAAAAGRERREEGKEEGKRKKGGVKSSPQNLTFWPIFFKNKNKNVNCLWWDKAKKSNMEVFDLVGNRNNFWSVKRGTNRTFTHNLYVIKIQFFFFYVKK